jgi:hypothetical protein
MILKLWLLAVPIPYAIWSLIIGPDFAVGLRAYWVAAWHLALAWDACARCLPGRSERLAFVLSVLLPWSGVMLLWMADAGAGHYRKWATEYWVITGACFIGALQCGLASLYAVWRGKAI